jgi:hypothetical protein
MWVNKLYYHIKPAIPRPVQIAIRQSIVDLQLKRTLKLWPIDPAAGEKPIGWPGWPGGKKFALVLTHDVDTAVGQDNCIKLKDLEKGLGFRSSFNFVPERYLVSNEVINNLKDDGFEIGVHGLHHDGKLFNSKRIFTIRAGRINHYLKAWGAVGFRSPSMHHNLSWLSELNINYDCSTFDTDPFEPQSDGVGTIFPFWLKSAKGAKILELPYTLPQDFSLFVLLKNTTTDIWKQKLDWVAHCEGMALINVHPDYLSFGVAKSGYQEYPYEFYTEFLRYVENEYSGQYWLALPRDVYCYCKDRFQ